MVCINYVSIKLGEKNPMDLHHGYINNRKERAIDTHNFSGSKLHYVEFKKTITKHHLTFLK